MIKSFLICDKFIFIGNINELIPSTSPTLAILDPTTLPMAIGDEPPIAATILTTNSGSEVPNATTVNPITMGDKPKYLANRLPPFTINSAP